MISPVIAPGEHFLSSNGIQRHDSVCCYWFVLVIVDIGFRVEGTDIKKFRKIENSDKI